MREKEPFAAESLPDGTTRIKFPDGIVIAHREGFLTVKTPQVINVIEKEKSRSIPAEAISALRPRFPVALKGSVTYIEDEEWLDELHERAYVYPEAGGDIEGNYRIACRVALDLGWEPFDVAECIVNTEERMAISEAFGHLDKKKLDLISATLAMDLFEFYPDEWKAAHINE